MKIKNLKFLSLILLLLVAMCFSACGSINAMTLVDDGGHILQLVSVQVDEQALREAECNIMDVYNYALNKAETIKNNLKAQLAERLLASKNDEEKLNITSALLEENFSTYSQIVNNTTFKVGLKFYDIKTYRTVYNIEENSTQQFEQEKHFLYSKLYYKTKTLYNGLDEFYSSIITEFNARYNNLINENDGQLLYTVQMDLKREHSDANYITKADGKYYHTWVLDKNNLDRDIVIYYNVANAGNCILLCIGISLVLGVILILIGILINKKKKKNKK